MCLITQLSTVLKMGQQLRDGTNTFPDYQVVRFETEQEVLFGGESVPVVDNIHGKTISFVFEN